ncbi:MAG: 50S ribosomal protein L19 [Deltaproteobacteria bacterium]|nr:50S ribosomal protein L19 [Deltaproteobacteria bacterium]
MRPMKERDVLFVKRKFQPLSESAKSFLPKLRVGARVKVSYLITEGNKKRIQVFEGIVIAIKKPNNPDGSFTVRKVSFGVGVERTYPINSPNIAKVEVISYAKVRRAKLYFLRDVTSKKDSKLKTQYASKTKKNLNLSDDVYDGAVRDEFEHDQQVENSDIRDNQ